MNNDHEWQVVWYSLYPLLDMDIFTVYPLTLFHEQGHHSPLAATLGAFTGILPMILGAISFLLLWRDLQSDCPQPSPVPVPYFFSSFQQGLLFGQSFIAHVFDGGYMSYFLKGRSPHSFYSQGNRGSRRVGRIAVNHLLWTSERGVSSHCSLASFCLCVPAEGML